MIRPIALAIAVFILVGCEDDSVESVESIHDRMMETYVLLPEYVWFRPEGMVQNQSYYHLGRYTGCRYWCESDPTTLLKQLRENYAGHGYTTESEFLMTATDRKVRFIFEGVCDGVTEFDVRIEHDGEPDPSLPDQGLVFDWPLNTTEAIEFAFDFE